MKLDQTSPTILAISAPEGKGGGGGGATTEDSSWRQLYFASFSPLLKCSHGIKVYEPCADPGSFVRGGPTFTKFYYYFFS